MNSITRIRARRAAARLAVGSALFCAASAGRAQDCGLSVQIPTPVLRSGQTGEVRVLAHFPRPPAPGAPYAFAAASFDVFATQPLWTSASGGAIAGGDVLGIDVAQRHAPQQAIYADPTNPFPVWRGRFAPQSEAPALVEITADPSAFAVYPSKLTSSSAPCEARAGRNFIFVNPLSVGRWVAAPRDGTEVSVQDDVIVDGRIITAESYDSAAVGLLLPGIRPLLTTVDVEFPDGQPATFAATVQVHSDLPAPVGEMSISFVGLEDGAGRGYSTGANFVLADGSVRFFAYEGFRGGVSVAAGDLDGDGDDRIPALVLESVPQTISGSAGRDVLLGGAGADYEVGWILTFDRPTSAVVRSADGTPRAVTLDRVEVRSVRERAQRLPSGNNLKQLGLGCHNFEVTGARGLRITPSQPR